VSTDPDARLAHIQAHNRSWAVIRIGHGSYQARQGWWGNQQIVRVPNLNQMRTRLQPLSSCTGSPWPK